MIATELEEFSDLVDALKNCNEQMTKESSEFDVSNVRPASHFSREWLSTSTSRDSSTRKSPPSRFGSRSSVPQSPR